MSDSDGQVWRIFNELCLGSGYQSRFAGTYTGYNISSAGIFVLGLLAELVLDVCLSLVSSITDLCLCPWLMDDLLELQVLC